MQWPWPSVGPIAVVGSCLGFAFACQATPPDTRPQPAVQAENGDHDEGHEHTAPHGGSLVELGEEFAHLELVLDSATGTLTAYALDGEAEQPVRIAAGSLALTVTPNDAIESHQVTLQAIDNPLTGERVGDTSQFRAIVAVLAGQSRFRGHLVAIQLRGRQFSNVAFEFPAGH